MSVVFPDFLTLKTFLFLFSLALAAVRMCRGVCVPPSRSTAAAPGDSQGKTCCCGTESRKEPLLIARSKVVPGWVQPRRAPPALISEERIKCDSLGIFLVVVRAERQQWKIGEGGSRQRKQTTFLGAGKHVACLGSGQSLFWGCIVSCGNWLRPKPSPGSSSCTFCSKLPRMDPN